MALHADDLVLVKDGALAHHGPCADSATHAALTQVFDGRVAVHPLGGRWVALPVEEALCL
jgi:iron complex transport system ATP-binding protein